MITSSSDSQFRSLNPLSLEKFITIARPHYTIRKRKKEKQRRCKAVLAGFCVVACGAAINPTARVTVRCFGPHRSNSGHAGSGRLLDVQP
jgi:hypothetical protein